MYNPSTSFEKRFLRPDELIDNDARQITWIEKIIELAFFPFTWLAMVLQSKKPTLQEQLAEQIIKQEHARISSMRQSAMMKADAARSEVMRDELAKIYEETMNAELKMSYLLMELSKGVSLDIIEKAIDSNTHRTVRNNTHQAVNQRFPTRVDPHDRFDVNAR